LRVGLALNASLRQNPKEASKGPPAHGTRPAAYTPCNQFRKRLGTDDIITVIHATGEIVLTFHKRMRITGCKCMDYKDQEVDKR